MAGKKTADHGFQFPKVFTISSAHLLHDVYSSFLAPLLPLLIEKLGITYTLVSLLSFIQRTPNLLNPFIGVLADRVSVRYLVIFSPLVTAVSMSLIGIAPSYIVLAILLLSAGFGASLFHVPAPVMIRKVSGNRIGKGMSYYMTGGEIARTAGPLIIVGTVSLWGLENTWWLISFALVLTVILYFRLKDIRISDELRQKKQTGLGLTFRRYLPFFMILTGFVFFRAFMKQGLTLLLPTYLNQVRGQTFEEGGLLYALFQLAGVFGVFFSGRISDRIGRRSVLLAISIGSPFLMWLFVSTTGVVSLIALILLGLLVIAQGPVLLAYVNEKESDRPAFINSVYMTISFLIGAVAVLLVGIISDWIGLGDTFLLSAVLALAAVPFLLRFE